MVLVVTRDKPYEAKHRPPSCMMLTALQLSLDSFELGYHSLLPRDPPDDDGAVAVALPTIVGETQESENLRFSLSKLLPVTGGKPPELSDTRILSDAAQTIDSAILAILGAPSRVPASPRRSDKARE